MAAPIGSRKPKDTMPHDPKDNQTPEMIKAADFTRKELDDYMAKQGSTVRDLLAEEERRTRHHKILGLTVYEQGDMVGDEVKDAKMWRAEGYLAAMRGEPAKLPVGMSGEFTNDFLGGHADGVAANNKANPVSTELSSEKTEPEPEPEKPVTRNQETEAL